jgi:hypothetical protein
MLQQNQDYYIMILQCVVFMERYYVDMCRGISWTERVAMRGNECGKYCSGTAGMEDKICENWA